MNFDWSEYLRLARELADQRGDDAAMRTAISRAYYAAFNIASRHKAAEEARSSQAGPHQAVWRLLKQSGNSSWRRAGNMGLRFMEIRQMVDYIDMVPALPWESRKALGTAETILHLLSS